MAGVEEKPACPHDGGEDILTPEDHATVRKARNLLGICGRATHRPASVVDALMALVDDLLAIIDRLAPKEQER